uniref:VWFC domain-containing protein n=1 Tax=Arion vulgaris TaxID=1028688 RepID=A0A0B7A7Y1_9EUPU
MEDKRIDVTDQPGCEFHGSHYEDGDIFPSNKTALKPKHSNQCVLCACYRGHVICHLKTCLSTLTCQKTMKVDDDCCLQCEQAPSLEDFTKLISDNMNHTLEEGDCLLTTGRQRNGTTWKPVIGQYGEMKCIICACINGQINCGRLQCPEHSDVKCDSSKVDPTGCCKQCTQKSKQKTQTENEEDKCLQTTSDNNQQKKHCMGKLKPSRNKRNRKKNVTENGRVLFQAEMHLNEVLHKLCIGDKSRHLVYHTRTNHFEALAIDLRNEQKIEQIYWTIRKGKFQTTERKYVLDPEEYRRNITVGDILGTVQKKDVKGFLRRLDKAQQKCKRKCKRKMLDKAIKRLRVQDVDLTKSCDVSPSVH